ncbi:TPA: DUF551 domain-containing protein [Escherichia coli]|nr:DUF551 domain-containing protein [Escherichia coli]
MTTITKERLLTIKQWRETYGPGSNVVLPAEEAEELARIALTSLEAEPIGEVSEKQHGLVMDGTVDLGGKSTYRIIKGEKAMKLLPLGTKFYTAPPAPITPEAIENAIEYIRSIAFHIDEDDYHGKHIAYFMRQALAWLEGHSCSNDRLGKADNQPVRGNQAAESNRGNEWTGNPDIDNAIIMLDRIDTLENCDDDRIEAVKAVLRRLAGNSPVIPGDVLSAILKVARVRADFDDFDGDRRGIADCLDEAEQELIVTINKHASQLAAGPIAPNDVREQTAIPPVPGTPDSWISCSERMPDKLIPVMVMYEDGEMWSAMWNGNRWDDGTEYPDPHSVTHWREMPAEPPQEVNRG